MQKARPVTWNRDEKSLVKEETPKWSWQFLHVEYRKTRVGPDSGS